MTRAASVGLIAIACLVLGCGEDNVNEPEELGSITIRTTTIGEDIPAGFDVSLDGVDTLFIAANGSLTFTEVAGGQHFVSLNNSTPNCEPAGNRIIPVPLAEGQSRTITVEIECEALVGSIGVSVNSFGEDLDPDGYLVSVDDGPAQPLGVNDGIIISGLSVGEHAVAIDHVAGNCAVDGESSKTVTVEFRLTTHLNFRVDCEWAAWISFEGDGDIFIARADGSERARLTLTPEYDGAPRWSPDGTRLAFESDRAGNLDIYSMNADGTGLVQLTVDPGIDREPVWSPDGARIAFTSERDGNEEIYVIDADGSGETNVSNNPGRDADPSWSPDGSRFVYWADAGDHTDLFAVDADGSNRVNLTNFPAHDIYPAWSPDGMSIAFGSSRDGTWTVFLMDVDGSNVSRLTDESGPCCRSVWAPDGSHIALYSSETSTRSNIRLVRTDGWELMETGCCDTFDYRNPVWYPDGMRIAYESNRSGDYEIYVMNREGPWVGPGLLNLTDSPGDDRNPNWSPFIR
jgi:Tol biopolymer transport system component